MKSEAVELVSVESYYNPQLIIENDLEKEPQIELNNIKSRIKDQNCIAHEKISKLFPEFIDQVKCYSDVRTEIGDSKTPAEWLVELLNHQKNQENFDLIALRNAVSNCHSLYQVDTLEGQDEFTTLKVLGASNVQRRPLVINCLNTIMRRIETELKTEIEAIEKLQKDFEQKQKELQNNSLRAIAKQRIDIELETAFNKITNKAIKQYRENHIYVRGIRSLGLELIAQLKENSNVNFDRRLKEYATLASCDRFLIDKMRAVFEAHKQNLQIINSHNLEHLIINQPKIQNSKEATTSDDDLPLLFDKTVATPKTLSELIAYKQLDLSKKENRDHWQQQVSWRCFGGGVELLDPANNNQPMRNEQGEIYKVPHAIAKMFYQIHSAKMQNLDDNTLLQNLQNTIITNNNRYKFFKPTCFDTRKSATDRTYEEITSFNIR